jgi:hypothetical protein
MFAFGAHLPFPENLQFRGVPAEAGPAANPALAKLFWTPYPLSPSNIELHCLSHAIISHPAVTKDWSALSDSIR